MYSLRQSWPRAWRDLWRPLINHRAAPPDLSIELFRLISAEISKEIRKEDQREGIYLVSQALRDLDIDLDLSSPIHARSAIRRLRESDFKSDFAVARLFENASNVVEEFDPAILNNKYRILLHGFISRYNLGWTVVDQPLRLRPWLPASFESTYRVLKQVATDNAHLGEALEAFERAWADHAEAGSASDMKTVIDKAAKLAEAFVGQKLGRYESLGVLADVMKTNKSVPHATIADMIKRLYGFCSDYPHIRHGGNPAGKIRDLQSRDALLASLVLIAFTSYALE